MKKLEGIIYGMIDHPGKRQHSRWKLSQELKRENWLHSLQSSLHGCGNGSRERQTYQNEAKNLCRLLFVFDLNDECKFMKNETL